MSLQAKQALLKLEQGDWRGAHQLIQDESDKLSCLIHAHLHRMEGDEANADYWYRRAGCASSTVSLDAEFDQLKKLAE